MGEKKRTMKFAVKTTISTSIATTFRTATTNQTQPLIDLTKSSMISDFT